MLREKRFDILALGEPMIEFNQSEAGIYRQGFGGDTANFAVAAARQGAAVAYCTRLGNDRFGRMLLDLWRQEMVDVSCVEIDPEAHTGIYFVTHDDAGHHFEYLRAGSAASRMQAMRLPLEAISACHYLHVSGISQAISESACDAVFFAMEAARKNGVRISYDPNLRLRLWPLARAKAVIEASIARADVFLPGFEEAMILSGSTTRDTIFAWCLQHGARQVVLKCGAEGAWIWQHDDHVAHHIPALKVQALDATGAGDCFDGALIARLVAGDSLKAAAHYANAAAGLSATGYGAVAPIPVRAAVLQQLATQ